MAYFGSGKYLEPGDTDAVGRARQSFYGILDEGDTVTADSWSRK